jgi:hypothetical protein
MVVMEGIIGIVMPIIMDLKFPALLLNADPLPEEHTPQLLQVICVT